MYIQTKRKPNLKPKTKPKPTVNIGDLTPALVMCVIVWFGGVAVGRRIRDQEVASSIPSCSAARCNSGQVVHTHVPLFTKQYKLVPASAGE